MKTSTVIVGIIMLLIAGAIGWLIKDSQHYINNVMPPLGSVAQSSEYHSTPIKTTSNVGGVITTYPSTLGSIIVPTTLVGGIKIFNATTTDVGLRADATSSLTLVGFLDTGTTPGTYTFDSIAADGLVYFFSTISSSTITWR